MRYVKVAAACLNQIPLDWEHNKRNILDAIKKARSEQVAVLCLPELCITGYGCEDTFLSVSTSRMALSILQEILPETKDMIIALGVPLLYRDGLYNTACLVVDGKIAGFAAKQHLAGDGVHYEPRWFKAWPKGATAEIAIENFSDKNYPLGDLVFEINGIRIGFEICEDAWAAERTGVCLAQRGVDFILNPSASHFGFGKVHRRKRFVLEGGRAFNVCYIYANLLGNESGRIIYDGDTLITEGREFIAEGPRFSFQEFLVTSAIIDVEKLRMARAVLTSSPAIEENLHGVIKVISNFQPFIKNKITCLERPSFEHSQNMLKEEEFVRACTLGLFDYLRKSRAKGFVLNLSGGADSAACACLVYLMVVLGLNELGKENFQKKLSAIVSEDSEKITSKKDWMQRLLVCIYQKSKNNTDTTRTAAFELAMELGASFLECSIDSMIDAYSLLTESMIGRKLSWSEDDIALQNIQSRVRTPSAWMLANIRGSIFLCTSNRSEASTGYGTMDGDMSGGISPLGGIDKSFILQWLKWLESGGMEGIDPIKALQLITTQRPAAELRPPSQEQTDEADLMPYDWLDAIERFFIRDRLPPKEILCLMQQHFPNEPKESLAKAIERFLRLWCQNQWKRERLAVSFHLDEENVDPKTWCRFPILSGGYQKELEEMWRSISPLR